MRFQTHIQIFYRSRLERDVNLDRIILESIQNTLHEKMWESFLRKGIQQLTELLNPVKVLYHQLIL